MAQKTNAAKTMILTSNKSSQKKKKDLDGFGGDSQ